MKDTLMQNTQKELGMLQEQNEAAYRNLCNTIHCAWLMQLEENAEKAFFARNTADFNCYDFCTADAPHFEKAYQLFAHAKTYVYMPKNKANYFVIFCVDRGGMVRYKRAYESPSCMRKELKSFKNEMQLCVPMYHIDQCVVAYYAYLEKEVAL